MGVGVAKGKGFAPPRAALTYAFARRYHLDTGIKPDFHKQRVENSSVIFSVQLWQLELESERGNFRNETSSPKKESLLFCLPALLSSRPFLNNTFCSTPFPKHFTQMPCQICWPLPSSKMPSLLKLLSTHHWSKRSPPTLRRVRDLFREIRQSKWNINITPDYPKMILGIMHELVICIDTSSRTGS
jgi:hypothetical protein